jgi:iron(III) transport system permease protein
VSRLAVVGVAAAVFALCSLMPVGHLLVQSLAGGIGDISALSLDARQRGLLWNTGVLGVSTATLATALGAPLGIALARVPLPLKGLLRLALAVPVLLPPYIVALAWTYLIRSERAYSLPGAIIVLSLVFYPLSMLATEVALRRIDGRLEQAGLVHAPSRLVLRRISLPLAAPGILAAALIIFVLSVSEFGVPGLLRVRVYTTEVFTAFAALYDFGRAVMLAVPLLLVSLVAASVAILLMGDHLVSSRRGLGTGPASLEGWQRGAVAMAITVITIAVGIPLLVLVNEALGVDSIAAAVSGSGQAIQNSVRLSAVGATAVVGIALWLGYARARVHRRIGQFADVLMVVAFAVPSTIVGVGLIGLWNRPGFFGSLYGTEAMLIIGYLARFIPVAVLMIAATMRYVPVSQEEAAAVSGAGWFRTMSHIVIPQVQLGLLAAWVIAFVLAFGELGVSILVSPAGETTLPIRIYTIIANTAPAHVAALALLQTTVILCPVAMLGIAVWMRDTR